MLDAGTGCLVNAALGSVSVLDTAHGGGGEGRSQVVAGNRILAGQLGVAVRTV